MGYWLVDSKTEVENVCQKSKKFLKNKEKLGKIPKNSRKMRKIPEKWEKLQKMGKIPENSRKVRKNPRNSRKGTNIKEKFLNEWNETKIQKK